jgi:phytanoyl-CoA hydroxylase
MLTPLQLQRYRDDGYLVLPDFKSAPAVRALRERARAIVDAFDPAQGSGVFATKDQAKTSDAWFLGSAHDVRCFFEAAAFDAEGRLQQPKAESINKIGHALHELDPVFAAFSHGTELAELASDLGLRVPQLWQSMVIFKPPRIGGEVLWHQDATFLCTEPNTVTGFWFALEDADASNGCLQVQPGGHRGPLRERFVRDGDALAMQRLDDTPWPTTADAVPLPASAGTLVVLHGLLPHCSAPNRSPHSRCAYTLHAIDGRSRWLPSNWLQRQTIPAGF